MLGLKPVHEFLLCHVPSKLATQHTCTPTIFLILSPPTTAVVSDTHTVKPTMTATSPPSTDGGGCVNVPITVTVTIFVLAIGKWYI